MTLLYRNLVLAAVVVVAVVAQVAVLPVVAVNGVVPNLALLVVVAASLSRGPETGVVVAFGAGLLLDLAPPAEHVAGRWAFAFVLAAILAGRVRGDARDSPLAALATVGACSFVATSVFALSGQVLGDHAVPVGQMIGVVLLALLWDVVVAPLILPALMRLLERSPARELAA